MAFNGFQSTFDYLKNFLKEEKTRQSHQKSLTHTLFFLKNSKLGAQTD